jgi:hypothetical protein
LQQVARKIRKILYVLWKSDEFSIPKSCKKWVSRGGISVNRIQRTATAAWVATGVATQLEFGLEHVLGQAFSFRELKRVAIRWRHVLALEMCLEHVLGQAFSFRELKRVAIRWRLMATCFRLWAARKRERVNLALVVLELVKWDQSLWHHTDW